MDGLTKAISAAGGVGALAALLGLRQTAVSNWRARGRIPAEWCPKIEAVLGGRVGRHELRPDIYAAASSDQSEAA